MPLPASFRVRRNANAPDHLESRGFELSGMRNQSIRQCVSANSLASPVEFLGQHLRKLPLDRDQVRRDNRRPRSQQVNPEVWTVEQSRQVIRCCAVMRLDEQTEDLTKCLLVFRELHAGVDLVVRLTNARLDLRCTRSEKQSFVDRILQRVSLIPANRCA